MQHVTIIAIINPYLQVDGGLCPERVSTERKKYQVLSQISRIESETTEAGKKIMRTLFGIKEYNNPLLDLPIDLYK